MPEFTKDIIDLNELNRRSDINARRKAAKAKRIALRVLIAELALTFVGLIASVLRLYYIISQPVCILILSTCVIACTYLVGWHAGYRRAANV